jgi:hypothetical protein
MEAFSSSRHPSPTATYLTTIIKRCVHPRHIPNNKKKKGKSRSNCFSDAAIVVILQLIVQPHRTFRTETILLLNRFFRFSRGAKENPSQLRFTERRACRTNALLRVFRRVRNCYQLKLHLPLELHKTRTRLHWKTGFEHFGRVTLQQRFSPAHQQPARTFHE